MKKEIIKTIETDLNDIDDLELMNLLDSLFEDVTSISEYEINKLTENKKLRKIIEDYVIQNNIYFIDDNYINKSVVDQYLEEIGKIKLLDDQEEFELAIKAKNGDKSARARLINANLRLVVSIIKKYYYYTKDIFPDLIGEGNMGLVYSYEKFDPSLGYKFSTYATWWIRLYISKYFENKARNIHIPVSQLQNIKNIIDEKERYMSEFGKNISYDELASRTSLSISKIFELESVSRVPESLDRSVNDEREVLLSDLIVDDNPNPEDIALGKKYKNDLRKIIDEVLTLHEQDVIYERYGFDDGIYKTQEEVSKIFDVTRSAIGQLEARALNKMKQKVKNFVYFE